MVGFEKCCRVEGVGFGKWCWVKRVGERENLEFKWVEEGHSFIKVWVCEKVGNYKRKGVEEGRKS